jgi:hypothetical protein
LSLKLTLLAPMPRCIKRLKAVLVRLKAYGPYLRALLRDSTSAGRDMESKPGDRSVAEALARSEAIYGRESYRAVDARGDREDSVPEEFGAPFKRSARSDRALESYDARGGRSLGLEW